jgi:lantibiotic modifying enzyme
MNAEDKLNRISELLLKSSAAEPANFSLLSGDTGIALFLAYFYKCSNCEFARKRVLEIIEQVRNSMDYANLRLSDGLSGQLWTIKQIEDLLEMDLGSQTLAKELIDSLNEHAQEIQKSDQLDLLHGLLGIELCLSRFKEGEKLSPHLDQAFLKHSKEDDHGVYWYESLGEGSVINLGLAHGQASHLCYLAERVQADNCVSKPQFKNLIRDGIKFLESCRLKNALSEFPSFLEDKRLGPSRLAWCYGDLGVGIAYLKCAESTNDASLYQSGLEILKKTTLRKKENESGVQDLGFCHGSAGLCHIYDYLFRITSDEIFLRSSSHWLQYTLQRLFEKENTYRAYLGPNEGWVESVGLLNGLAGIGLVILNQIFPGLSRWEEIFYLKPIRDGKYQATPPDHSPTTKLSS